MANFWFAHGFLAVFCQAAIAAPLVFFGLPIWLSAGVGAVFVLGAYIGRERMAVEHVTGRNTPLWDWRGNPKALKDIGVPAALVCAVTAALAIMESINGF